MRIALAVPQITENAEDPAIFPDMAGVKKMKPDLICFPEQFLMFNQKPDVERMKQLARNLNIPCLVGVCGPDPLYEEETLWSQFFLSFRPSNKKGADYWEDNYTKKTKDGNQYLGWEDYYDEEYDPNSDLAPNPYSFGKVGITICHDLFLGGLFHKPRKMGPEVFVNATHYKVQDAKWGVLARMRALENAAPLLLTLHADGDDKRHHPYAFDANGQPLPGIRARDGRELLHDDMYGAGEVYVFDIPGPAPLSRSKAVRQLPPSDKNIGENRRRKDSVQVEMSAGQLLPRTRREDLSIARLPEMDLLDFPKCFEALYADHAAGKKTILWSDWGEKNPPVEQWLHIMLARSLEFSVPVVLTSQGRILELTERASDHKQIRRCQIQGERAWVELHWADGLKRFFRIVCTPEDETFPRFVEIYKNICV